MADNILTEKRGRVLLIRLNRPDKLNALNSALFADLNPVLDAAERDDETRAMVLTGVGRAFAAGADIAEMVELENYAAVADLDFISGLWERIPACRKPVIAAVNGFALGGGCELAMMCDFILAGESAQFSQPEIKIGTIPGAGGSQRMTRLIGRAKAMEMCLTGRMMGAAEAERAGLVARVVADADLVEDAMKTAAVIAGYSLPVVRLAKEAVNAAEEMSLAAGLRHERRLFHSTFGLRDRAEGMRAFVSKRAAEFRDE